MVSRLSSDDLELSIALCTYNGEAFLSEQLDSLATQTFSPDELVVCDDGSTDRTVSILEKFSEEVPFPVRIYINSTRLGVLRNFEQAISFTKGRYIALCDQDDIWHPDKLEIEMASMRVAENEFGGDTPVLIHADLRIITNSCRVIGSSFFAYQRLRPPETNPFNNLLVQNYVTGCTALMNRALLKIALPVPPQAIIHDWWLALCAALYGEIRTIRKSVIDYRQHGKNQVGAYNYLVLVLQRMWLKLGNTISKSKSAVGVRLAEKYQQAIALQKIAKNINHGAQHEYAATSLREFLEIFQGNQNNISRLCRAFQCNVRPIALMNRLNYLISVAIWRN